MVWLDLLRAVEEEPYNMPIEAGKIRLKSYCEGKWLAVVTVGKQ